MSEKITQKDVWESQKKLYDLIRGIIYGFAIGVFVIFLTLMTFHFLSPKQEAVPTKSIEQHDRMLRLLVESNLLNAGYIEFHYFAAKIKNEEDFKKLKISDVVDLDKCVVVNFDRGYIRAPVLFMVYDFTVEKYLEGSIVGEYLYCKKDAYKLK